MVKNYVRLAGQIGAFHAAVGRLDRVVPTAYIPATHVVPMVFRGRLEIAPGELRKYLSLPILFPGGSSAIVCDARAESVRRSMNSKLHHPQKEFGL
jgi:hypothetical protein